MGSYANPTLWRIFVLQGCTVAAMMSRFLLPLLVTLGGCLASMFQLTLPIHALQLQF